MNLVNSVKLDSVTIHEIVPYNIENMKTSPSN